MERLDLANHAAVNQANQFDSALRPTLTVVPSLQKTERMPFTIRIVRDDDGLQKP